MPSLLRFLQDRDPGYLRIVAELAGLELPEVPRGQLPGWLTEALTEPEQLNEQLEALSPGAREALEHLLNHGGQIPFADFSRQFGPIRDIGPARRDRELLWRSPVSPLEELWYRAYIGRGFLDTPAGVQEFAYIPDEIFTALGAPIPAPDPAVGRPAPPPENVRTATSALVDDATTLLAALRRRTDKTPGEPPFPSGLEHSHLRYPQAVPLLIELLEELDILDRESGLPRPEQTRSFLQSGRSQALRQLLLAWRDSAGWNDLAAVGHLHSTKDRWPNDPLRSRTALLSFLAAVPTGVWWDFPAFCAEIEREHPGFQRPAGDFDSWYFQDDEGHILHGIGAWPNVEGALLRSVIERTMLWLGAVDLGLDSAQASTAAFRLTPASPLLFDRAADIEIQAPPGTVELSSGGRLRFARSAPRALRYQIARFADWHSADETDYYYSISPEALRRALEQGLQVHQVRTLLEETGAELPPSLVAALDRYARAGLQAHVERLFVLRTESPAVMEELRTNRGTRRYIKELLGPQIALVEAGQVRRLVEAALRAGLLVDSFSIGESTAVE
jgi:hypothetical protein